MVLIPTLVLMVMLVLIVMLVLVLTLLVPAVMYLTRAPLRAAEEEEAEEEEEDVLRSRRIKLRGKALPPHEEHPFS